MVLMAAVAPATESWAVAAVGAGMYGLGAPLVHGLHGNGASLGIGLGLRLGLVVPGGIVVLAGLANQGRSAGMEIGGSFGTLIAGGVIAAGGALAAVVVDAALLAYDEPEDTPARLRLSVCVDGRGPAASWSGSF